MYKLFLNQWRIFMLVNLTNFQNGINRIRYYHTVIYDVDEAEADLWRIDFIHDILSPPINLHHESELRVCLLEYLCGS